MSASSAKSNMLPLDRTTQRRLFSLTSCMMSGPCCNEPQGLTLCCFVFLTVWNETLALSDNPHTISQLWPLKRKFWFRRYCRHCTHPKISCSCLFLSYQSIYFSVRTGSSSSSSSGLSFIVFFVMFFLMPQSTDLIQWPSQKTEMSCVLISWFLTIVVGKTSAWWFNLEYSNEHIQIHESMMRGFNVQHNPDTWKTQL